MRDGQLKGGLGRRIAWVGVASSAVALLDILALVLILKYWVSADVYGVATVVVTLFGALELVAELGLSAAVIQRDGHSEEDLSTIFWLNILFGFVLYLCIFLCAPLMAKLHGEAIIKDLFRVFGLNIILRAAYALYQAQIKKHLRFRELSIVRIIANLADFAAKVGAAAAGLGVWCFVAGHLARSLVFCIGLPLVHRWRPRAAFRVRSVIPDLVFGIRSAGSEILFQLYSNLDYQVVHYFFGSSALGFYRAAYEIVLEPVRFVSGVVVAVAFPAFSRVKHDLSQVADLLVTFCKQNLVVVMSLLAIVFVSAEDLLSVLFKSEYASAANTARLLVAVGLLRALSHLGPPLLDGLGRPDLTLRYQLVAALLTSSLFLTFAQLLGERYGYASVAMAWAVGYPIAFALLLRLVFATSGMRAVDFARRVLTIPTSIALALAVGFPMRWLLAAWEPGLRLAITTAGLLTSISLFLFAVAGVSPRSVLRSLHE